MGNIIYPPEFSEDWVAYQPNEGDPKKLAFSAWEKSMKRTTIEPNVLRMIPIAYNAWLLEGNKRTFRPSKARFATFYNQDRWQTFEERAQTMLEQKARAEFQRAESAARIDRLKRSEKGNKWDILAREIGKPEEFNAWFSDATLEGNSLIVPSPFKATM